MPINSATSTAKYFMPRPLMLGDRSELKSAGAGLAGSSG
jgi:hypothetical protein